MVSATLRTPNSHTAVFTRTIAHIVYVMHFIHDRHPTNYIPTGPLPFDLCHTQFNLEICFNRLYPLPNIFRANKGTMLS